MRTLLSFEPSPLFAIAMVKLVDPVPWGKSVADKAFLESMVAARILPPNTDPAPPNGYIVSLAWLHERGFGVPAGRFLRALCRQCHLAGDGLCRRLRGLLRDAGALGSMEAPISGWPLH